MKSFWQSLRLLNVIFESISNSLNYDLGLVFHSSVLYKVYYQALPQTFSLFKVRKHFLWEMLYWLSLVELLKQVQVSFKSALSDLIKTSAENTYKDLLQGNNEDY